MPLYDYKCANGHVFEELQSWSADTVTDCKMCDEPAKRQMSVPMVLYKGSGFYTTDYARNGSSNGSGGGSNGESESKKNGESKSSNSKDSSKSGSGSKKESAATAADKS